MNSSSPRLTRRATLAVGMGSLLLLGACGSRQAGSGDGTAAASGGGTTGSAGTGTGSGSTRFDDRASTVAQKLTAAGVPAAYGTGVVLLEDRVIWPGFADDLAKQAALAGRGVLALPKVKVPPTAPVDVPGGSPVNVTLQSPDASAAEAITQPCGPAERCTLSLDTASLTTRSMLTNHGRVEIPVWKYTGGGLDGALYVVAATPESLTSLDSPDLGLPFDTGLAGAQSLGAVGGTDLAFVLGTGSCDTDVVARVLETDDLVVVGGTVTPPSGACDAAMRLSTVHVRLRMPLGQRPVVDVISGAILRPSPVR